MRQELLSRERRDHTRSGHRRRRLADDRELIAPRILKFFDDNGRNRASRALQSAVEDCPRGDSVRIAVAEDAQLGIG